MIKPFQENSLVSVWGDDRMKKSIAVFATGKKSSLVMAQQIRQVFSNESISVSAYWLEGLVNNPQPPVMADLALISCQATQSTLAPFIHPAVPLIIANRTLKVDVIDQLIDLPAGSKTLLITKTDIGTTEAMQTLSELGFSHFSVHSFLTDDYMFCSSISTILLFDEPDQIPAQAKRIIDLGVREIELSSLVELACKLNEPLKTNIPVSIKYLQEIVDRSQRMLKATKLIDLLNRQLSVVLNKVTDCLIVVDVDFIIRFFNDTARAFIGPAGSHAIGEPLKNFIPELHEYISHQHEGKYDKCVVMIAAHNYHVNLQYFSDITGEQSSTIITLRNVTEVLRMETEVRQALHKRGHVAQYSFANIIGDSAVLRETIRIAKKLAASDLNVLIYGENGTGKELFAHSIHNASARFENPFVAVNCAALSPSLLESELFGYEEGAFTGAKKGGKMGLIEQADKGTLFLDEIGDITLDAQTKLLRVLQERALMRIGGGRIIPVNIRIIAATNRDLRSMVANGQFRQDLFFRLFVAPLAIPPLRTRREDIPALLRHFMVENQIDSHYADEELLESLRKYSWPGNIRELNSIVQYAGVICDNKASFKNAVACRIDAIPDRLPTIPIDLSPEELPLYLSILSLFSKAKSQKIHLGRKLLSDHLQREYPKITEQALRSRLVKLTKAGFLISGIGRQGTQITDNGERFRISHFKNI